MSATPSSGTVKLNPPAFYCAAAVILLFSLAVIGRPEVLPMPVVDFGRDQAERSEPRPLGKVCWL